MHNSIHLFNEFGSYLFNLRACVDFSQEVEAIDENYAWFVLSCQFEYIIKEFLSAASSILY